LRALTVGRADLLHRKIHVVDNMPDRGKAVELPKNHRRRTVALPRFLVDDLADLVAGRHLATSGSPTHLATCANNSNFRRNVFDPAAKALGLGPLTPHELWDTAASLAGSAGANVKVIQRMLGYASASMILDLYSGLLETDMDEVAERMDAAARASRSRSSGTSQGLRTLRSP